MSTPELSVLKPIDPSITDPDDYEIFSLSNAQVLYASNGKPASLLIAYADIPLRVEGRLETPTRAQLKYLVNKPFKPTNLEIRDVTRFSYGQTTDGDLMIWALGSAGWFEIRPSKSYKSIYEDMVQAVEILYFMTDIYNEPRKRGSGPSAELIFQEYAEDDRFSCNTKEEAEAIFHRHRAFLIMCFLNRAQGLRWSNTPIYQFFKRKFTKEFEASKARVDGKKKNPTTGSAKPRAKGKANTSHSPKKNDNWWESAAIFEFMQKAVNQGAMHKAHITVERVAKLLVKRYEIDDVDMARNVVLVHATNLCYMMAHPRRRNTEYLASEPIYTQLSSFHNLSAADIRRAEGIELRPRKDHRMLKENLTSSEEEGSSDEVHATTPQRRRSGKKKGQFSGLRPRSNKYHGKGKGKGKGKGTKRRQMLSDEESETKSDDTGNDTPTQTPSPGKRKRNEEKETTRRKRLASHSVSPESAPSSVSSDVDADANALLPLRWRDKYTTTSSRSLTALLPPVVSRPLPTYTANAPGDVWACTFDGCSQKIYGASMENGDMLIREHLADHSRGRAFEIGLVLGEEQRSRLPVSNLIKRIREMAERQQPLFPSKSPSPAWPTPIERTV